MIRTGQGQLHARMEPPTAQPRPASEQVLHLWDSMRSHKQRHRVLIALFRNIGTEALFVKGGRSCNTTAAAAWHRRRRTFLASQSRGAKVPGAGANVVEDERQGNVT